MLSEQQQAVVDWVNDGVGSLELVARAGCGKTYTLIEGVVRHASGTKALMAFNKSAADEFTVRLQNSGLMNAGADAATMHSMGFRALRQSGNRYKIEGQKVRWIVKDKADVEGGIYRNKGAEIVKLVSYAKQSGVELLWDSDSVDTWQELIDYYLLDVEGVESEVISAAISVLNDSFNAANHHGIIDFDDMLLMPLLNNNKIQTYDWVLIDEAQDTNAVRRELALKMMRPDSRLVVVGDPMQAIYGFTGADSDAMDIMMNKVGIIQPITQLPLTVTYRCPKLVVLEANKIVPDLVAHESAPDGMVRNLMLDGQWYKADGLRAGDAVLCRNTKPLIQEAYKMIRNGIGCRVEGREIGEGLVKLATQWKVTTLGQLIDKVNEYQAREIAKLNGKRNSETKIQYVEDRCTTVITLSESLIQDGKTKVQDFVDWVNQMFGDTPEDRKANVPVLSTIHKAKGREWDRVYVLDRPGTLPSKYAKQDWQKQQERNLEYVAITRAKSELIDVGWFILDEALDEEASNKHNEQFGGSDHI